MIELREVSRAFGSFTIERVSLRVPRGHYWVLLGPSGSGKTLLLHTLAGLHSPDRGRVLLGDRDCTELPTEARDVGLVFQQGALFPHLSVRGNVEYGLRARGVAVAERHRRVDELIATLGLGALLPRPVATLSGGEAQRVALARALAPAPAVLLLDEPLGPVDHAARLELQTALLELHRAEQLTILHVTHSHDEARALGQGCAVMVGGRLVQAGSVEEVFNAPICPRVAHLLGAPAPDTAGLPRCSEVCRGETGLCDVEFAPPDS